VVELLEIKQAIKEIMEHYYKTTAGESADGYFTYPQLYSEFVNELKDDSVFVEVGSWKGKSIAYLGVEVINSGKKIKCYAVDTWKGSPEHTDDPYVKTDRLYSLFMVNMQPVSSVVTAIRKPSTEAAIDFEDESVDIVFIDACHEYACVKEDIAAWLPKVKKGGIISGHDYYWGENGVKKAVDEAFGDRVIYRNPWENCWIVRV
jgi:hypothetical protein